MSSSGVTGNQTRTTRTSRPQMVGPRAKPTTSVKATSAPVGIPSPEQTRTNQEKNDAIIAHIRNNSHENNQDAIKELIYRYYKAPPPSAANKIFQTITDRLQASQSSIFGNENLRSTSPVPAEHTDPALSARQTPPLQGRSFTDPTPSQSRTASPEEVLQGIIKSIKDAPEDERDGLIVKQKISELRARIPEYRSKKPTELYNLLQDAVNPPLNLNDNSALRDAVNYIFFSEQKPDFAQGINMLRGIFPDFSKKQLSDVVKKEQAKQEQVASTSSVQAEVTRTPIDLANNHLLDDAIKQVFFSGQRTEFDQGINMLQAFFPDFSREQLSDVVIAEQEKQAQATTVATSTFTPVQQDIPRPPINLNDNLVLHQDIRRVFFSGQRSDFNQGIDSLSESFPNFTREQLSDVVKKEQERVTSFAKLFPSRDYKLLNDVVKESGINMQVLSAYILPETKDKLEDELSQGTRSSTKMIAILNDDPNVGRLLRGTQQKLVEDTLNLSQELQSLVPIMRSMKINTSELMNAITTETLSKLYKASRTPSSESFSNILAEDKNIGQLFSQHQFAHVHTRMKTYADQYRIGLLAYSMKGSDAEKELYKIFSVARSATGDLTNGVHKFLAGLKQEDISQLNHALSANEIPSSETIMGILARSETHGVNFLTLMIKSQRALPSLPDEEVGNAIKKMPSETREILGRALEGSNEKQLIEIIHPFLGDKHKNMLQIKLIFDEMFIAPHMTNPRYSLTPLYAELQPIFNQIEKENARQRPDRQLPQENLYKRYIASHINLYAPLAPLGKDATFSSDTEFQKIITKLKTDKVFDTIFTKSQGVLQLSPPYQALSSTFKCAISLENEEALRQHIQDNIEAYGKLSPLSEDRSTIYASHRVGTVISELRPSQATKALSTAETSFLKSLSFITNKDNISLESLVPHRTALKRAQVQFSGDAGNLALIKSILSKIPVPTS